MKSPWAYSAAALISLAFGGATVPTQAATITLTPGAPVNILTTNFYTDGNTTFNFTSCNNCSGLQIEAVFNGRNGTEIEILRGSAIFSNAAGSTSNSSLNFVLNVAINPGSRGISTVTNILQGSATLAANNASVQSVLSNFTGVTSATGVPSSNLTTSTSSEAFALLSPTSAFSFTATLSDLSKNATRADTLILSDVKLLFNPAPEPATIGLLAVGMLGLAAARQRLGGRGAKQLLPGCQISE